ncbi:MAG: orotate phosphoribosyltransferase [Akkermansiaceae bacterium]
MNLAKRIWKKSKISGTFELRSGKTSSTYFDKYLFESDPVLLADIAEGMKAIVPDDIEILAGLEMGGIPIVTALSRETGLHCAFVRKEAKKYGTCKYSEGANLTGKKVLLIEDVVSSGGAIIDAANMLRADGVIVDRVLCVIDRETGGRENLAEHGVTLSCLFKQSQIDAEERTS